MTDTLTNVREVDTSREKIQLLCVNGQVNGIQIKSAIDSGASEYSISETLAEGNEILWSRIQEKMNVHLVDGCIGSFSHWMKETYVAFEVHSECWDFYLMTLPKYNVIWASLGWIDGIQVQIGK